MRRIGGVSAPVGRQNRAGECRWSPNGKTLAFAYAGVLYTIPAD